MEILNIFSLALLVIFGIAYFAKLIILSQRYKINANVFGKGVKPKVTMAIERCFKVFTFFGIGIWIVDALFPDFVWTWFIGLYNNVIVSSLSIAFIILGVALFIAAMIFMKTSWRAGIDQTAQTSLITSGVYRFSRNPAFLGVNLMFIGEAMTFGNVVTMITALLIVLMVHLQIRQEEIHMGEAFAQSYHLYAAKTPRYFLL